MKVLKPKEVSEMLNVAVITLQRWDREGKLKAFRTPTSNRRYYTLEQINEFLGESNAQGKTVIYARVSSNKQKKELEHQVEFLKEYCNSRGIIVDEVITEIGSGMNYKRKKWNKLIRESSKGEIKNIIIAYADRFVRFGYDWFENFLKEYGVNFIVVNNEKLSPQEEMVKDLMTIIHIFSCRLYGLRKYGKKVKEEFKNVEE
ncbi:MAG: IS607 family transposase [Marinisporobacter sp.]|jgi:predicted site-specific integrase-resolvase|nr:IS607 family transposase [Marinisporobacter sp.]